MRDIFNPIVNKIIIDLKEVKGSVNLYQREVLKGSGTPEDISETILLIKDIRKVINSCINEIEEL